MPSHDLLSRRSRRAGDLVYVGATDATDEDGTIQYPGDVLGQARVVWQKVALELQDHGASLDDIVDVVVFVKEPREIDSVWRQGFNASNREGAAWTLAAVSGTRHPAALVAARVIAHTGDLPRFTATPAAQSWRKRFPGAAVVRKGDYLFVSGQSGLEPDGSAPIPQLHIPQARKAYELLLEAVAEVGSSLDDLLDFTSFHEDIRGAEPTLATVYIPELLRGVDPDNAPTTSHLGALGLASPGTLSTFRSIGDMSPGRRVAATPDSIWWKGFYPIAGAAKKAGGRLITIAGQVACNPDQSVHAPGDPRAQAEYIWHSMAESLAIFGATMADVIEVTSFHKDLRNLPVVLDEAAAHFEEAGPAWSAVQVPGLWMEGYLHEISATAWLPEGNGA
ncbi:RidA family protein [Microbacterium sp. ZW CA_36]|uniref:RidA family protein n=1 Tax=Microbacterium sp. ZW CA_36 TaxID=3378078 RepID=UPI003854BD59